MNLGPVTTHTDNGATYQSDNSTGWARTPATSWKKIKRTGLNTKIGETNNLTVAGGGEHETKKTRKKTLFRTLPPDYIKTVQGMHDGIILQRKIHPGCGATEQQQKTNAAYVQDLHMVPIWFFCTLDTASSCTI